MDNSGSMIPNKEKICLTESRNTERQKERIAYIDYFKAISIVYVILVHSNFANHAIKPWLMSFVVCVFFFASGIFLKKNGKMSMSEWKLFVGKKFRGLMIPYYLWALIFTSLSIPNLAKIIYASYQTILSSKSSGVLWFLPSLFLCFFMYACCRMAIQNRFTTKVKIAVMSISFGIAFLLPQLQFGYPMGLNAAFSAFGFFLMANCVFPYMNKLHRFIFQNRAGAWICILIACVSFGGTLLYLLNPITVSVAIGRYGNFGLFFVVAVFGIVFTLALALAIDKFCPKNVKKCISYIGRNTFAIFVLHNPAVKIAEMVFQRVKLPNWAELIITCVFAIAVASVGNWLISLFAPVLLGKSEKSESCFPSSHNDTSVGCPAASNGMTSMSR